MPPVPPPDRSLCVRSAVPGDAEVVARMARALNLGMGWPECRFTAADFRAHGFGPDAAFHTVLAELGDAPVGYAMWHRSYDTETARRGSYLTDLYVDPAARGRGVGRALMAHVARATRADGGEVVFWVTRTDNHVARPFYARIALVVPEIEVWVAEGDHFQALCGEPAGRDR